MSDGQDSKRHAAYVAAFPVIYAAAQPFHDLGGGTTEAGRALLARAWVEYDHRGPTGEPPGPKYWPVWALGNLAFEEPEVCWQVVVAIVEHTPPPRALYALALRVRRLIVAHGEPIIAGLEKQAPLDPAWKTLLGAIWRDGDIEEYWHRIAPLRGPMWEVVD